MKRKKNYLPRILIVFFANIILLCGCVAQNQNIDKADVDETFEKDYEQLQIVTEYLLSLDRTSVIIRNSYSPLEADGEKIEVDNKEVKKAISYLFNKGYLYIVGSNTRVYYARWKRNSSYEFRAGFAYTTNSNGNINVQFLIKQQELSVENWYYYEEDYNEWRLNNS